MPDDPAGEAPPPPRPSSALAPPPPGMTRIRWGIGDIFWVLMAQLVGSVVGELIYRAVADVPLEEDLSSGAFFSVVLPAGAAATVAALFLVSRRKGRGSLRVDFGLEIRWRDWSAFLAGVGWQVVLIVVLVPFALLLEADEPAQELIEEIEETRGALLWVAIVTQVVVIQPAIEEVIFRGMLLRSLLRRFRPATAIAASGLIFGGIHVTGTGVGLDALPTIVGLSTFGMVLAILAVRHRSLSRPILTHMGFNLAVVLLSAAGSSS